jgi:STE24 endopeptidase
LDFFNANHCNHLFREILELKLPATSSGECARCSVHSEMTFYDFVIAVRSKSFVTDQRKGNRMIQYNILLWTFLVLFIGSSLVRWILTRMNIGHLRRFGNTVPDEFEGDLDENTLAKMTAYTVDSSRFGSFVSFFDDAVLLVILLSGLLPWYVSAVDSLGLSFILSGLIFFAGPAAVDFVLDIPFDFYRTFGIEKRHGFSTTTVKLWIADLIKGLFISLIFMGILLGSLLAFVRFFPQSWWFWGWLLFALFQLFVLWIYPIVIAPLFNKFIPVSDDGLREKIFRLVEKANLPVSEIFQVDAGKRSRHSNAYFTGLGKTKRIVLFDTLIASHSHDELLSVLAHEIGHWKKRHIIKQLFFIEILSLILFYVSYRLITWPLLYETFGFERITVYVGLFLLSTFFKPLAFFLKPLTSSISRRYEREADDYANQLMGTTAHLISALRRLAKDNLANLYPHPLYARVHYSHPPLTERIARLRSIDGKDGVDFSGRGDIHSP